jgi:hypothetical protein
MKQHGGEEDTTSYLREGQVTGWRRQRRKGKSIILEEAKRKRSSKRDERS